MADLLDNSDFYIGALAACASLVVIAVVSAFRLSSKRAKSSGAVSPALLFLAPYFAFFALGFGRPYFDIQDVPSVQPSVYFAWVASSYVMGLYFLGGLAFFAGYLSSPAIGRRYGWFGSALVRPFFDLLKHSLRNRKLPFFVLSILLLWGIGFAANLALFVQVQGIPLFQIGIREKEDPKLTFLAEFQPLLVLLSPFVTPLRETLPGKFKSLLRPRNFAILVAMSLAVLTLLGARNLPAKLVLSLFLFWLLSSSRITPKVARFGFLAKTPRVSAKTKVALFLAVILFVSIGVAGALSKVEIYRMSPQRLPAVVLGSLVADSIGNLYSFGAIVNYSGMYGHFHGNLLYTTFLSYVPGREELYANYIVGEILGYPESALQSISSTFNGPALLDFGILGVIVNSFLFGSLLGYGWSEAKNSPRNQGALALFLATVILDIHLGTYNIWTFFAVVVLVACVEYNKVP